MCLASALLYSLAALLVRVLSDAGLPMGLLIGGRALLQTAVAAICLLSQRLMPCPESTLGTRLLLIRAVSGCVNFTCFFIAVSLAPLGDASAIVSMYPVLTMLGAYLWLGEALRLAGVLSLGFSGTGLLLLAWTTVNESTLDGSKISGRQALGYCSAFLSCLAAALNVLTIRRAGNSFHPLQGILLHSICTVAFGGLGSCAFETRLAT
jgi:drug/metabolite transporter (DMT)-like permease